jgi:Rieske Fe-S protein
LRRTGAAFAIFHQDRKINLILAHADHHRYVALDRACTHNGAMCTYNRKRQTLQCTSLNHAEYDMRGTLLHGRTHGNLRAYDVENRDPFLTILLGPKP